jgi:hypothetical protein
MRAVIALGITLLLLGLLGSCGGGASPSPVQGAPGVTTPASPLASPAGSGGYDYGY